MKRIYLLICTLLLCTLGGYAQSTDSCRIVTLPYTENFDTYGTGTSVFPNCWTKLIRNPNNNHAVYILVSGDYNNNQTTSINKLNN